MTSKAGRRHNQKDQAIVDGWHKRAGELERDMAELGAAIEDAQAQAEPPEPEGNTLKALSSTDSELRVGNHIVMFGGKDLTGEHFSPKTQLESDYTAIGRLAVDWEHGQQKADGLGADDLLGYVDWATQKTDDRGVWVERVLNRRKAYVKWLEELIRAGMVGTSSQAVAGKVRKTAAGEILVWPLYRDALTVQPAEPRMMSENVVAAMKALGINHGQAGQPAPDGATVDDATPVPDASSERKTEMPDPVAPSAEEYKSLTTAVESLTKELGEVKAKLNGPALPFTGAVTQVKDLAAEKPFKSFGEQLIAIKNAATTGVVDVRLLALNAKFSEAVKATGASEGVGADGGFLVQQEFTNDLLARMFNTGEILKRVNHRAIGAGANGIVINTFNETSRANGSRFGGLRAYWLNEGGTKTASTPAFRRFTLNLEKLAALFYATDELLQDATALGGEVSDAFRKEIQFVVEDAIVNGDGVGKPLGILAAPATVEISKETGQAAATLTYNNLIGMFGRLWNGSMKNAVWLVNQGLFGELMRMYMPAGLGVLPAQGITFASGEFRLFGLPVIFVEYMAAPGTIGDIALVDLSEYRFIDKGDIQSDSSIHVKFTTDETAFRWVYRCNGAPFWNSALTPYKGSATLSPMVSLATRA